MTGSSNDYGFAGTPNAKYSYVVELRDRGEFGFLIPEEQILPTGEESYDGVIALLNWIIENNYEWTYYTIVRAVCYKTTQLCFSLNLVGFIANWE